MTAPIQRSLEPLFCVPHRFAVPSSPKDMEFRKILRAEFIRLNGIWHSRLPVCTNCFEGVCFGMLYHDFVFAVAWWSKPVAQNRLKNGKKLYELRRMAIADDAPKYTATRFISLMTKWIKAHRPDICRLISYQDTAVHTGTIYKAANWRVGNMQKKFTTWKNREDFNRSDQSKSIKTRWEYDIRPMGDA